VGAPELANGGRGAEFERRRREDRGAEGSGVWEGVSPSSLREGYGEGLHRKKSILDLK